MPLRPDEDLFERALAVPRAERAAWIARACHPDAGMREQIEALVRAHEHAEGFLEKPPPDLTAAAPRCDVVAEEQPGDRIGRYKLLQKIGEGGCGVVYMAEQEEAVRRRVALKVIKLGMDTKAVIARFEAERQALARMEHPNIARVLDAGATAAGRPFFVMELVRGLRITEYCDQNNLPTEQRLDLFIKVCQAIQHAHQKGIIHRDIKPSNILVTLHDGQPVPKVIDFGIAKATHGRLTDHTLFTAFEQFIGTPAYVSPEQAEMSGLDIDTRSDIYSLGVLLYELLMGRTPFDTSELVQAGIDEMRRRIREQEPPRPSHRLRTLNDSDRTTVAKRRGTDAPKLTLRLRGDLDWIVMRCLEKDRARRYETANGLARDIQRHLQNEPVSARPPSTAYLLQKLMRRHRFAFIAGTAVTLALATGFAVSTTLYLRAEAGKRRGARMADTVKDILMYSANGGDRRALQEMIAQALDLKKELRDQPEAEASVDETLSGVYSRMGDHKRAEEALLHALQLRTRAQGSHTPEVAQTLNYLGLVYSAQSRWDNAAQIHLDALELQRELFGPEHIQVARTMSIRGWVLMQQAKHSEAEQYLRLALAQQRKLGTATDVATTLMRLGSALTQEGRLDEAERVLKEALEMNRTTFGDESLEAASALNALAVTIALTQSRLPEAIELYRDAFAIRERIKNPGSAARPRSAEGRAPRLTLETLLAQRDTLQQVEAALRDAQLYATQQYGRDSWEEAFYHALRVWVLLQEQRYAEAEPIARQCLEIREKLRPDDWSTHHARHLLGDALAGLGHTQQAESLLVQGFEAMAERAATIPEFHKSRLGESVMRIQKFYARLGRSDEVTRWQARFNSLSDVERKVLIAPP